MFTVESKTIKMKKIFFYSAVISMTIFSCADSEDDVMNQIENDQKKKEMEMMKSENASPDMLKPSTLMSRSFVKGLFNIPNDEDIDFSDKDGKCAYDFVLDNKSHHIDLMFYFPGELDAEKATKMYEQLTTKYTKAEDAPQQLEGVADQATWSAMGGGQLIARHNNEIIILNMSVIDLSSMTNLGSKNASYQAELIGMGKKIIAEVISKLEEE
jgi:hypothetical protein